MWAVTALALLGAPLVQAADCPYPLGDFILEGNFGSYGGGTDDPEWQIVDAVRVRPQYSYGQIAYDGSNLHFVYETETSYLVPGTNVTSEVHIIAYKEHSPTAGWNTTRHFISSDDPTVKEPGGTHTQPTMALRGDEVWAAWQVSGWTNGSKFWPQTGTHILYRGRTASGWGSIEALSPLDPSTSSRLVKSAAFSGGVYFAYQTNAQEPDTSAFHLAGRFLNGSTLGPIENISVPDDLWSDEVVSLAVDGGQLVAVWASRNTTEFAGEGEWQVKASVRSPSGVWGPEILVSPAGKTAAANPSAAFYDGRLFVAWSTNDPSVSPGGDRSIVLRGLDVAGGELGPMLNVTDGRFPGLEDQPALAAWGSDLHVAWVSRSAVVGNGQLTSDGDVHTRTWNASRFGGVRLLSDPRDVTYDEFWPGFFTVGGALHAFFIMDVNTPATGKLHDQREMTRLVARPPRGSDGLEANFSLSDRVFLGEGTVNLTVSFRTSDGAPATSDHFALLLANGTPLKLPPGFSSGTVNLPFQNSSFLAPRGAAWCGKPIPLTESTAPPPPDPRPGSPLPVEGIAVASLLAAAAACVAFRRALGKDE